MVTDRIRQSGNLVAQQLGKQECRKSARALPHEHDLMIPGCRQLPQPGQYAAGLVEKPERRIVPLGEQHEIRRRCSEASLELPARVGTAVERMFVGVERDQHRRAGLRQRVHTQQVVEVGRQRHLAVREHRLSDQRVTPPPRLALSEHAGGLAGRGSHEQLSVRQLPSAPSDRRPPRAPGHRTGTGALPRSARRPRRSSATAAAAVRGIAISARGGGFGLSKIDGIGPRSGATSSASGRRRHRLIIFRLWLVDGRSRPGPGR